MSAPLGWCSVPGCKARAAAYCSAALPPQRTALEQFFAADAEMLMPCGRGVCAVHAHGILSTGDARCAEHKNAGAR